MHHSGIYSVMAELRRKFWIPRIFSTVKKCLRECTCCRKVNNRTVALSQNAYRDFRLEPPEIPFRYVFIDYIGPFHTKVKEVKSKTYLLIITCLWSRAINLKVCSDMSVENFLRAFQLHIYNFGLPERCYSDSG